MTCARAKLGDDVIGGVAAATMYPSEGSKEIGCNPVGNQALRSNVSKFRLGTEPYMEKGSPALASRRGRPERRG